MSFICLSKAIPGYLPCAGEPNTLVRISFPWPSGTPKTPVAENRKSDCPSTEPSCDKPVCSCRSQNVITGPRKTTEGRLKESWRAQGRDYQHSSVWNTLPRARGTGQYGESTQQDVMHSFLIQNWAKYYKKPTIQSPLRNAAALHGLDLTRKRLSRVS